MNKPRLYVDFNELIDFDLVLLSKFDVKFNSEGSEEVLFEGKQIEVYMDDFDENGVQDNLIASGIVKKNNTGHFPIAKWLCRIDTNVIKNKSSLKNEK